MPPAHLLAQRVSGVLAVIYLAFNEGYAASVGEELVRAHLCEDAIALGRAMCVLMPDELEAHGLLALMVLQHARRDARVDVHGDLIGLEDQDRERWHGAEIEEGLRVLESALRRRDPGPYQLQAAIVACHAQAPDVASTDWIQIVGLYDLLSVVLPTPVVALNRAVAVAMAVDLDRGLALVDEIAAGGELDRFHLLWATRADLLRRRGDRDGAREVYGRALALTASEPERRLLRRRQLELGGR